MKKMRSFIENAWYDCNSSESARVAIILDKTFEKRSAIEDIRIKDPKF